MARKTKRRTFSRPRPQQRKEDLAEKRYRLESAARTLLATRSPEHLRVELSDRAMLLDEADRAAQLEPSPVNLSRYRFARAQFEIAEAAMSLQRIEPWSDEQAIN